VLRLAKLCCTLPYASSVLCGTFFNHVLCRAVPILPAGVRKQVNENGANMWGMLTAESFQPILEFDFLGPDSWAATGRAEGEVVGLAAGDKLELRAKLVGLGTWAGQGWLVYMFGCVHACMRACVLTQWLHGEQQQAQKHHRARGQLLWLLTS
jgi:hypothetical protein